MRAVARIGPAKDEHFLPLLQRGGGEGGIQKKGVKNTQTEGCGKKSPYLRNEQGGTNNVTCFNSLSHAKSHLLFRLDIASTVQHTPCTCHS
jgi:hypothetical protein